VVNIKMDEIRNDGAGSGEGEEAILPEIVEDSTILVNWYRKEFNASYVVAALPLAVFVLACKPSPNMNLKYHFNFHQQRPIQLTQPLESPTDGVGGLFWSPLSEVPVLGRNIPYMTSFLIFVVLSVPTALAGNLASLVVLRFSQSFFGSPCLSNGGASMGDMVS